MRSAPLMTTALAFDAGEVSMVEDSPLTWTCCCCAAMVMEMLSVFVVPGAMMTPLDSKGVKPSMEVSMVY